MLFWVVGAIWLIGAWITYIADGWFDSDSSNSFDSDGLFFAAILWPIMLVLAILFFFPAELRKKLQNKRKEYDKRQAEQEKVRIAQIREAEALQKKAELELSEFMSQMEEESKQKRAS